jgi:hypothetical protein
VELESARVHPQGAVGEPLEQRAVVADDEAEPAEPDERLEQQVPGDTVEVVGRLVEEQHVRLGGERGRDLPARALPRGQGGPPAPQGRVEVVGVQRQPTSQPFGDPVPGDREGAHGTGQPLDGLRDQHG